MGKNNFLDSRKKRIFAQKVIDMEKNDTKEPLGTTAPDEQKDVRNMENPYNYLEDRRDAFCGLGMQLDVWYDEYTKYIRHYDNSRQLNALCHIREGVSAMLNICGPIGESKKDDILVFFGEKSDDVANLENFGRMFILERKMAWDKSVDGTPQGVPLAVVGLFYFYHALNHKIEQLRSIISYDVPFEEDGGQMEDNRKQECKKGNGPQKGSCVLPAELVEEAPSPEFVLDPEQQSRWEAGYDWLVQRRWIRKSEVDRDEWVYICCGRWTDPKRKIIWRGTTAELACMVRYGFDNGTESKWDTARKVFILKDNKPLPTSFESTRNPAKPVLNAIQDKFMLH